MTGKTIVTPAVGATGGARGDARFLGAIGGIGLLIGPVGLMWLNIRRTKDHGDRAQKPMDHRFIALLFLTSLTGLL